MKTIKQVLNKKKFKKKNKKSSGRKNPQYGLACEVKRIFNISIPLSFKLLKKYSLAELRSLESWWGDFPFEQKENIGLLIWKLKQKYPGK